VTRHLLTGVAAVLLLGLGAWWVVRSTPRDAPAPPVVLTVDPDTMRLIPDTVRVKVELLNGTGERGLARRVAQYLRDRGFDVVLTGDAPLRDSSLVLERTGATEWSAAASRAMQGATIESRPDSLRFLDLTIIIGRSFRPPSQILYP
jgi:hypothetical protein